LTTIAIELQDDEADLLKSLAQRLNVPAHDLAKMGVLELIAKPSAEFEAILHRVLEKNSELYRRLA